MKVEYRTLFHIYHSCLNVRALRNWSTMMHKDIRQNELEEEMARRKLDMELDQELEATFPASDALKITRTDGLTRFSRQNRRA